jgi:hypothetical protein
MADLFDGSTMRIPPAAEAIEDRPRPYRDAQARARRRAAVTRVEVPVEVGPEEAGDEESPHKLDLDA